MEEQRKNREIRFSFLLVPVCGPTFVTLSDGLLLDQVLHFLKPVDLFCWGSFSNELNYMSSLLTCHSQQTPGNHEELYLGITHTPKLRNTKCLCHPLT